MSAVAWASIAPITDSIGVQYDRLKVALGTGTDSGSVRKAANLNAGRVAALADDDATGEQATADMLQKSMDHRTNVTAGSALSAKLLATDILNIANHILTRGGANGTWDAQAVLGTARYSNSFADVARLNGQVIDSANVFPPVATSFGTFALTGTNAGTFTAVTIPFDVDLYGGANIEALALSAVTSCAITATCLDEDGITTRLMIGTLVDAGSGGTKVDLTVAGSHKVTKCTAVTVVYAGAGSQSFKIQTKADRTPAE